jgi:hypothetical protein
MEEKKLNYKKDETVYLPSDDGCYSIRKFDWSRIKRKIDSTGTKDNIDFKLSYSILYGVGVSAGLSIIPIAYADNLPSWVTPLYVIISIFGIGLAVILNVMDNKLDINKNIDLTEIKEEMEEVEKMFPKQIPSNLKIIKAIYGTVNKSINIAQELTDKIINGRLEINVSNEIAGDPTPGAKKTLTIEYIKDRESKTLILNEGDELKI